MLMLQNQEKLYSHGTRESKYKQLHIGIKIADEFQNVTSKFVQDMMEYFKTNMLYWWFVHTNK
jgi:hypothetical protein